MGTALTPQTVLFNTLQKEDVRQHLRMALPKHLDVDRLVSVALLACKNSDQLMKCTPKSLVGAVLECAKMGLYPDGVLGHAYLIPFKNNKKNGAMEAQVMFGYRGLIELAWRGGQVKDIFAHEVRENDQFTFKFGTDAGLDHVPCSGERGEITHFYMVAKMKDGGSHFEVMTKEDVDKVRDNHSQAYKNDKGKRSPWNTHYVEMGKKTVVRRAAKYLPLSTEFQRAAVNDEYADAGLPQNLANNVDIVDGTAIVGSEAKEQVRPTTRLEKPRGVKLSEKKKKFMQAAGANGWDDQLLGGYLQATFKKKEVNDLTEEEHERAFQWVSAKGPDDQLG